MPITAQALVLASLLIAPGLIAVLIAITLGVVEREVTQYQLYGTAFVSSILIDVVFVWIVQVSGKDVTGRDALENIFFTESGFQVIAAVGLFAIAIFVGVIYSIGLHFDIPDKSRALLGHFTSRRRNPWQPWEGTLKDADVVQINLSTGYDVVGRLGEYSRVGKERQIMLHSPQFDFEDEPNRMKILLFEDEIDTVSIQSIESQSGLNRRTKIFSCVIILFLVVVAAISIFY
ncbi:DUF6338 family protein [Halococcus qingdaonensis]|uniref:DUF6338 family protein n=1 Tax=Halococcus qingdaonensis TaxID=224402 RepID=UPI0021162A94|nr:DUF6338 family protein [Halococcus qingdaonensis]